MGGATIEVNGLRKRFGPVQALDGMSFTVAPGRVTGFIGPNGAGKSTTMRVILGLDAPDEGSALVGGRRYRSLPYPLNVIGSLLDAAADGDLAEVGGGDAGSPDGGPGREVLRRGDEQPDLDRAPKPGQAGGPDLGPV
jgi:energy-coupling factor transporter ATP-binding protein EcfA2